MSAVLLRSLRVPLLLGMVACVPTLPERPPTLPGASTSAAVPPSALGDRDGDEVSDDKDRCPDVAGVTPNGCEKDSDGDSFVDRVDRCPGVPGVEPGGCPISDGDGDKVLDLDDGCADRPETRNGYEDEDGCPDELPADLAKITGVLRGVSFEVGKDVLRSDSFQVLERVVYVLRKYPKVRVEISAHGDTTGPVNEIFPLSSRRANAVKAYLVACGIDERRIETRGAGFNEPIDTNKTARGRARNRRIEVTILLP